MEKNLTIRCSRCIFRCTIHVGNETFAARPCVFKKYFLTMRSLSEQKSMVGPNELLYFADVCAGPGGFSEYVLWRKGWDAKGFGFTLRGANDFKLEDFFAAPCEFFEPHYGICFLCFRLAVVVR